MTQETEQQTDYARYRGKCKEYCEKAVQDDPTLRLVRGWYHCPMWGKQAHWWTVKPDGSIFDPTVKQFPTAGFGADYEEFDGRVECAECGKEIPEEEASFESNYAFCSYLCHGRFVGVL